MNTTTSVAIGIVLILGIGGLVYWQVTSTRAAVEAFSTQQI